MSGPNYMLKGMSILFVMLMCVLGSQNGVNAQTPLPGTNIPKFVDPCPEFAGAHVNAKIPGTHLTISEKPNIQPVLSTGTVVAGGIVNPLDVINKIGWTRVWAYEINDNTGKGGPKGNGIYGPLWPAWTIEAKQRVPVTVTYKNLLNGETYAGIGLQVDQSIHWANPPNFPMFDPARMDPYTGPVPAVVHLHGGEVASNSDGGPDGWVLPEGVPAPPGGVRHGTGYNPGDFIYPNMQEPTTLFYHDHTLGATRLNLFAGLVGFYLLRGDRDEGSGQPQQLPAGLFEIELAIQDRMFDNTGKFLFPSDVPPNPLIHPLWVPEFFGDAMCVNGKTWPYLNVEARRYRFRVVDGCNARFLKLFLTDAQNTNVTNAIWQIGSDGGLLDAPVNVSSLPEQVLLMGPGERADIIIDFSGLAGKTLTLRNTARAPYPTGDIPDPTTVGQIMQFRVGPPLARGTDKSYDPASKLSSMRQAPIVRLSDPLTGQLGKNVSPIGYRQLTLNEVEGDGGPIEVIVNNSKWDGMMSPNAMITDQDTKLMTGVSELPQVGSTEVWEIVNTTMDAHPIHLHLVQFQLLNRQPYDIASYLTAYAAAFPGTGGQLFPMGDPNAVVYPAGVYIPAFGPPKPYNTVIQRPGGIRVIGGNPDVTPYLLGTPRLPNLNERGWKDTYVMYPGEVTRVVVRWAPQATPVGKGHEGRNLYTFDPTKGPGYVWHCHIVDHEDNEMMRPQVVRYNPPTAFVAPLAKNGELGKSELAALVNENLPTSYALGQNYPNPFNPTTQIKFALPEDTHVMMTLYNSVGQNVKTILDADAPAGYHVVALDAKNLASGVYYYRLHAGSFVSTQKMILMK
jgi:spore coat protein A, manganese oxidase